MSMNRVIHLAVRRDLARLRAALDRTTEGDAMRAADLDRAFRHLDGQLTRHHEGEHDVAWPAMKALGVDPALLEALDSEHEAMGEALRESRAALAALAASPGRAEIDHALKATARLETVTCAHLDHEEAEIEPLYLKRHDDPVVVEMSKQFRRRQSIGEAGELLAWLQDGASAEHRAALRALIPAPAVAVIGGLFGRGYRRDIAPVWSAG